MTAEQVSGLIDHVAHWLPSQGPIKEFVHHNTLHAFQERPFAEGLLIASRMYGSRPYLELTEYHQLLEADKIDRTILLEVARENRFAGGVMGDARSAPLENGGAGEGELDEAELFLDLPGPEPVGIAQTGIRSRWRSRHNLPMDLRTHPVLFRLVGQFLDQGVAIWRMPHAHRPFFDAVMQMVAESWLPLEPLSDRSLSELRKLPPEQVIARVLTRFVGEDGPWERYLLEMCLAHPGWSGMIHMIETQPGSLVLRRQISLLDFCALELMAEYAWAVRALGADFRPLYQAGEELEPLPVASGYVLQVSRKERLQRIWHEAYERTYARRLLGQVQAHRSQAKVSDPMVQAFFCIDDRECSIRRHLEAVNPRVQTFASAGFFGVDCLFQGVEDAFPFKHCPVPVQPKHLIREECTHTLPSRTQVHHETHSSNNTLLRGFLISQTLGLWASIRLALSIFRPALGPLTATSLRRVEPNAELKVLRDENYPTSGELIVGYSDAEMADRVGGQLRATGAVLEGLADLVIFFGHGASSVNNPYFAAYDCGACSGKPGAPNARAFALMANRPEVRAILRERGLVIPDSTWFVGALHDTTRDEVQYYELEKLPAALRDRFEEFRRNMEAALGRNAQERCKKFARLPENLSEEAAREEVRRRSTAIFEPRPELNHATNAACIVGHRALTRGLHLDRRSFLNSYNPACDPQGDILASILSAVVPVCGGINLEYFFSRMDPRSYGAGTKLPHNVNGLIGVMNGTEGDLLTGLPTQMTELHEPVRLVLLVQHEPEIALSAANRNPAVFEWIENGWMYYFSISPQTHDIYEYRGGAMVPLEAGVSPRETPRILNGPPAAPALVGTTQGVR